MAERGLFTDLPQPHKRKACYVAIPMVQSCSALAISFRNLAAQLEQQGDREFTLIRPDRERRMVVVELAEVPQQYNPAAQQTL